MEKLILIGGGVGPMAGVELHKRIIENTDAVTDQGHLQVLHFSFSHYIPDRTDYLLHGNGVNPADGMLKAVKIIENAVIASGKEAVLGIPCNTFHAPKIFDRFSRLMEQNNSKIMIVNMIKETAELVAEKFPNAKSMGLMSTTGTRVSGVYRQILEPIGYSILEVPQTLQQQLHNSIYNKKWGIKAASSATARARGNFEKYAKLLKEQGAQALILGCTEIPIVLPEKRINNVPLVDPMTALARALIMKADKGRLKNMGNSEYFN